MVQRICDLQQALDQALDSLENLQIRVATQHLVESQLIKTEHFANAQQQVITPSANPAQAQAAVAAAAFASVCQPGRAVDG
ncbi:MAG: hypothetical protein HC873_21480, partial [Leptolyngbyaceae cyanobacterium SL_1_1]|nr:hypothetical protein [Leptolyngbyaceae cyanobacterium SL_1_1]